MASPIICSGLTVGCRASSSMLMTDHTRSQGKILANTRGGSRRTRFIVAHELGHFLMERHVLGNNGGFVCAQSDMLERQSRTRHQKQEAEANQFAIFLLAPGYKIEPFLSADPNIKTVQYLSNAIEVSLEATMRHFLTFIDEPLAAEWSHNGSVRYSARSSRFPWISVKKGDPLLGITPTNRAAKYDRKGITDMVETISTAWIDVSKMELFEQTRVGNKGYALTLLWATLPNDDPDNGSGVAELEAPGFKARSRRK